MPTKDTISEKDMALRVGWALSVLKSDASLKRLFARSIKGNWDQGRFTAELQSTTWYKKHGEAARQAIYLKKADTATWNQRMAQVSAQVRDLGTSLGASISKGNLRDIAENTLMFGWNDAQIRDVLAQSIKAGKNGQFGGQAGVDANTLRETALNNGVRLSDASLRSWLQRIAAGEQISGFEGYIRDMAAQTFPSWAEQLKAGQDARTLADPYIEQMAKTLELNSAEIDLFTPEIRKALQTTSDASDKPLAMPMWRFEQTLKQDKRWKYTDGARNELDSVGHGVLRDMGIVT